MPNIKSYPDTLGGSWSKILSILGQDNALFSFDKRFCAKFDIMISFLKKSVIMTIIFVIFLFIKLFCHKKSFPLTLKKTSSKIEKQPV